MKLRYAAASTLFTSAIFLISCGGSKGGSVLPIGPGNGNDGETPPAGYLGGAVVQKSKLQLPGASLGTPDENTEVGETVACMNEVGEITHLEIYEYYEARELTPVNISLGAPSDDPWTRVADTLSKVNHLDAALVKELIEISQSLKASMRLLPSAKLLSFPMQNSIITLPANCFLLQAAMMSVDASGYQYSFLVDKTIWEAMNSDQKTGLILHETLKLYYDVTFLVNEASTGEAPRNSNSDHPDFSGKYKMNHRSFRQTHINFVDLAKGFRTLKFTEYLSVIGKLGQPTIKIGELYYLSLHIEFYNADERKVKRGYLAKSATIPSPSPMFKELTVSGDVSFYGNGKLKTAKVGEGQFSTSDGVPDLAYLYQSWPLASGGSGLLNGTVSFDENGQFVGMDFGFLNQKIKIKTELYDLDVDAVTSSMSDGSIDVNEVQSFNFMTANPTCRSCTGSITPKSTVNPQISFTHATIKNIGTAGHEIIDSTKPIPFKLADGTKLSASRTLTIDLEGHVISVAELEGFRVTCPGPEPVPQFGRIAFNKQGLITSIGTTPVCDGYKIVPVAF